MREWLATLVIILGLSGGASAQISCAACYEECSVGCNLYSDPAAKAACQAGCMRGCVLAACDE